MIITIKAQSILRNALFHSIDMTNILQHVINAFISSLFQI